MISGVGVSQVDGATLPAALAMVLRNNLRTRELLLHHHASVRILLPTTSKSKMLCDEDAQ
jgi:hypothetical protein